MDTVLNRRNRQQRPSDWLDRKGIGGEMKDEAKLDDDLYQMVWVRTEDCTVTEVEEAEPKWSALISAQFGLMRLSTGWRQGEMPSIEPAGKYKKGDKY